MLIEVPRWPVKSKNGNGFKTFGLYVCECGFTFEAYRQNVNRGNTTRCSACAIKSRAAHRRKHGHSCGSTGRSAAEKKCYYTWQAMKRRCYNPNENRYERYGGRGIAVCDSWLNSYVNFLSDMGLPPSMSYSIERADNDKDYQPDNCSWIDIYEQASNKSNTRFITANGQTKTLAQWARSSKMGHKTISNRIDNLGWSPDLAVQPADSKALNKYITPEGEFRSLPKIAKHHGMSVSGVYSRIRSENFPDWKAIERNKHARDN